ncbi:FdhF/YdeP family oxidoreductase [Aquincola tertiaricarbonis]|uniref:FdhF/YdeP family oxidoreductase n=1 Tax=Aquincola tertiaricarbonis TaxID=391953 RepID=UPI000614E8C4|nr:FdhF/YdeP family oxidoreductase [Aquincola tertiaricarbonis]
MSNDVEIQPYDGPVGGWGSVSSIARRVRDDDAPTALPELARQNKPDGFACVSCAWAKPANAHLAEFCENGAKATFAELTRRRVGAEFFARHAVSELLGWPDQALEHEGRLTEPLRYDAATDRYVPVGWQEAFADIGAQLKALQTTPDATVFYTSGRASLETAYLYQLFARLYGTNNLPDSSNMCHESTSVALKAALGVPVGTVKLEDFEHTDCLFFFGQNVGSNSPRMLHPLQAASERGVPIIVFNPLHERGLEEFTNPQRPLQMATRSTTRIASRYHAVKPGGDIAAITGLCKALLELDDAAQADGRPRLLDTAFIAQHTHGFDDFAAFVRAQAWPDIEAASGLRRSALTESAQVYAKASATIGVYGMGLTQHELGVDNVRMLVNLLLMRGNIGKTGAGACPVRGHSNVQGQRTVGIAEKPELVPLDRLAAQYGFEPPRHKGMNTVEACEGVLDGRVQAFIGLGGNFVRAVPDHHAIEPAWRRLQLTVHVATKLNRSHLLPGATSYLLPCLGRIERDLQAGGVQTVSVEDSTACIHASRGQHAPASEHLLSEPAIVAGLARATLAPNPQVDWTAWVADYGRVRDAIEATWPDQFAQFNQRMHQPGGFARPLPAAQRHWNTESGKAEFKVPPRLDAAFAGDGGPDVLRLVTLRSNDQFNTTVYGYDDRLRGIQGTRDVLLMNRDDMRRLGVADGSQVTLACAAADAGPADGVLREVSGLRVVAYDLPPGCCAGYYPECNPVVPLNHHARESKVPAVKSVPVRVRAAA